MFKKKIGIKNFKIANGRVLLEKTENRNIYKVLDVAQNANYEGIGKRIELDDLVVCQEYLPFGFNIDYKEYYIVNSKLILGFFS